MQGDRPKTWSREDLERARQLARQYLKSAPPPPREPARAASAATAPPVFGPLFKSAAVCSRFRVEDLVDEASDPAEVTELRGASIALHDRQAPGWKTLELDVRNAVLRQLDASELATTLPPAKAAHDPLQKTLARALRGITAQDLFDMESGELAALVQIYESLSTIVSLPPRAEIERKLDLVRLLEPLTRITATFSGRENELQKLRDYVGVLPPDTVLKQLARFITAPFTPHRKAPFLIYGQGGVGKTTLVARFILEHALIGSEMQFPFAYLDFDRPTVMAEKAGTMFLEAVRQIGLQYDSAYSASVRLRQRAEQALRAATSADESLDAFAIKNFADFLETLEVREGPVLFVLDTFEEVQRRSSVYATSVIRSLQTLAERVPRLRVVIAGRELIPGVEFEDTAVLERFDAPSAVAYLSREGIDADTAKDIFASVGGSPLALTLAVGLHRQGKSFRFDKTALNDELVIAQLFDRILLHIKDEDVRRLAHPGLVLRRVTPELIREVLAEPCGLRLRDAAHAEELFEKLAKETTLVTQPQAGVLVHRSDVRRLMLEPLRHDKSRQVEEIHHRAVDYYSRQHDALARAEQVYHRLSLKQAREDVAPLVTPELEPLLANAIDELAPPEQALLADLLGLELPASARREADQLTWERAASRVLKESMRSNTEIERATAVLAERSARSEATDLRIAEVELLDFVGKGEEAARLASEGIRVYREAGHRDLLFQMLLAAAIVDVRLDRLDRAHSHLNDAEALALRADDPMLLVRVEHDRAVALRASSEELDPEAKADLVTAVARIEDAEWARELTLLRAVAEEVGRSAPAVLGRALRLGALELTTSGLMYMRDVLREEGVEAKDVQGTLLDIIYRGTPSPKILDALIEVTRGEAVRRDRRALPASALPPIRLKTVQREKLVDLLRRHYGSRLALVFESRLQTAVEAVTFSVDPHNSAMDLVGATERDGRLATIIVGFARDRFDNAEVLSYLDTIGLDLALRPTSSLPEKALRALVDEYRGKLGALAARTCAIEVADEQRGCGVLVDADAVLSLSELVADGREKPTFRFDEVALRGKRLDPGRVCRLATRSTTDTRQRQVRVRLDQSLGGLPVDAGATDRTVAPRGVVRMTVRSRAAGDIVVWLWRERGQTLVSGVRLKEIRYSEQGLLILDAPLSPLAAGCACLDEGMNAIGLYAGALDDDAKRSAMVPAGYVVPGTVPGTVPGIVVPGIESQAPVADDPFAVCYAKGRVYLDRDELRSALRALATGTKRILLVKGPPASGKSYTAEFVRYLASRLGFRIVHLNLAAYAADREVSPVDLGVALADAMGLELPPALATAKTTGADWTREFHAWLASQAKVEAWIVVDGFDSASLHPAAHDFLVELLQRITGPLEKLRCVLIGYDRALPKDVEPFVVRETPRPIAEADLVAFFTRFREQQGLASDPALAARLAKEVFDRMNAAGEARLRVMARAVTQVCREALNIAR